MVQSFARSRSLGTLIGGLELLIEKTGDYFDDELTAQLNITKAWLQEAMETVRLHEIQRLRLADDISRLVKNQSHDMLQTTGQ